MIAPMGTRPVGTESVRTLAESTLKREVAALEAAGKRVVTFRPSPALRAVMGRNPLARRRSREITGTAFLEAAELLAHIAPGRRAPDAP